MLFVMDDIERDLTESQEAFTAGIAQLRLARQQAVMRAIAAGKSKYRIAQVLDVKGSTVDSIIESAERKQATAT